MKSAVRKWCQKQNTDFFNPLNAELNPICYLPALLGAHHIFHISGIRVKDGYQKLVQRWRKCVEVGGDFVEK